MSEGPSGWCPTGIRTRILVLQRGCTVESGGELGRADVGVLGPGDNHLRSLEACELFSSLGGGAAGTLHPGLCDPTVWRGDDSGNGAAALTVLMSMP